MRKTFKILRFLILVIILNIAILNVSYASTEYSKKEYSVEYEKWTNLSDEQKEQTIAPMPFAIDINNNDSSIPSILSAKLKLSASNYNLKSRITIKIENQQNTNECWAFSTNTVLETNLALKNNQNFSFSARHMDYSTTRNFLNNQTNSNGNSRTLGTGGNPMIALAYYTSGRGPILESDMPFENNENMIDINAIKNKKIQKKVEDYTIFPTIYKQRNGNNITYVKSLSVGNTPYSTSQVETVRNQIKEHIIANGAVTCFTVANGMLTGNSAYYNNNTNSYYCYDSTKIVDHQVTIVGWDDNYSKDNFLAGNKPINNGAYIVLNSWGNLFGNNGYYYISYDDAFVESAMIGIVEAEDIDYTKIYQHDIFGPNNAIYSKGDLYGANVFSRNVTSEKEYLTQVSFATWYDMNYEIYVNSANGNLNSSSLGTPVAKSSSKVNAGYHTINLKTPIELTGNKFAIVIKYILSNTENAITVECKDLLYHMYATSNNGESYLGKNLDNFQDLTNLKINGIENANICIKAFTNLKENDNISISSNKYKIDNTNYYIYKVSPKTTVGTFISNITTDATKKGVYNNNSVKLSNNTVISTGDVFKLNDKVSYVLAVMGDTDKDGEVTINDLVQVNFKILGKISFDKLKLLAGDTDYDNEITINDLVRINFAILGKIIL